jgi:hypothetical protein
MKLKLEELEIKSFITDTGKVRGGTNLSEATDCFGCHSFNLRCAPATIGLGCNPSADC